ncbi:alpha/beta hydrolase [Paenibacillus faecis]|uniref:alpha/beta hydrolase n=1 Tax=Paenibacillus faecis TaxID=862114 RepID=UPI001B2F40B9|nr:alpha/beta hydrolase [Paenibacillus faecis]GIO87542.1 alpha/beta hydrolase [Paenibacillus faecis]
MMYSILILVVLLLLLAVNGITRFAFRQITQMKLQTFESIFDYLEGSGVFTRERFNTLNKREVTITSKDGLKLSGYIVEPHPGVNKWVIIVHGYTVSLHVSTQYIDMFDQEGFNLLLVDQRRHGNSQGTYTTYGYYEKYDVQCWVNWLLEQYGDDCVIGLHGQSLGGGTVLEYLAIADPHVKFVVADCPYSDLTRLMRHQVSVLNKLPSFPLLRLVNRRMERVAGFRMEQVSPLKAVESSRIPVLFVHGTRDNYVPTYMSEELYERKPEPKRLLLVEGAVHANAYGVNPARYAEEVHALIQDALEENVHPAAASHVQESRHSAAYS